MVAPNVMDLVRLKDQGVKGVLRVAGMVRWCRREGFFGCSKPVRNVRVRGQFWKSPVPTAMAVVGLKKNPPLHSRFLKESIQEHACEVAAMVKQEYAGEAMEISM